MIINHNLPAMNTHRQLTLNSGNTAKALEKLSSGYRINRAGDDAAGLAISEKMRAQIRGLNMASKNSQDAISLVQTAEGALQETHNILQRMRELAVQSSSDTNEKTVDRAALQAEFKQLQDEIDDIASKTRFNDQNLVDGTFQKSRLIVGSGSLAGVNSGSITGISVDRAVLLGTNTINIAGVSGSTAYIATGNSGTAADGFFSGSLSGIGVMSGTTITFSGTTTDVHNGNTYYLNVTGSEVENMTFQLLDSNGNIVSTVQNYDTTVFSSQGSGVINFTGVGKMTISSVANTVDNSDIASIKALTGTRVALSGGVSPTVTPGVKGAMNFTLNGETVTLHKGDSVVNFRNNGVSFSFKALTDKDLTAGGAAIKFGTASITVNVSEIHGAKLTIQTGANEGDEMRINIDAMNTSMLGVNFSSIETREDAAKAITDVNTAINKVSTQRSALGALQNRLTHKIANLDTSAENLQAAESRIRDVDMAKEMMNFTKQNILTQAATAMLAQANQLPQNVLQLLR